MITLLLSIVLCRLTITDCTMASDTTDGELEHGNRFNRQNGHLFCENVRIKTIQSTLDNLLDQPSPCFIYSEGRIRDNVDAYLSALEDSGIPYMLGYALKANYNPAVLAVMKDMGCAAVTVSGNEVKLALQAGVSPEKIIFNGNGKQLWEVALAVAQGCLINVDSAFDLRHIVQEVTRQNKTTIIFVRINPDINADVHDFIATGGGSSKFGVQREDVASMLDDIAAEPLLKLLGLHCHLGSTIDDVDLFRRSVDVMLEETTKALNGGRFPHLKYLNLGGGLGIDYRKDGAMPVPGDLLAAVKDQLSRSGLTLVLEPGRSLIGDAAILVAKVIGCKRNGNTNYIVVDAGMTELIRPSLYSAYHHIELTEPTRSQDGHAVFNVVGPVCESSDFLGKDRTLPYPHEGAGIAVFDVGAYGYSMASNYNMRCRPAEVMVNGDTWRIIRKPDTLEDLLRPFQDLPALP